MVITSNQSFCQTASMKRFRQCENMTGESSQRKMPSQITPPVVKKRKLQVGQHPNLEEQQNCRLFEAFRKLDPSNPVEAKRINTRKKQIQKGKNTVGYDLYTQKIPKNARRKILEHPSTPDYKADIPNRRWLGQLKAWRISLHRYDPNDMKSDITSGNAKGVSLKPKPSAQPKTSSATTQSVEYKQIEDASTNELDLDLDSKRGFVSDSDTNGIKLSICISGDKDMNKELDQWESNRILAGEDELLDYDDSDDDIL